MAEGNPGEKQEASEPTRRQLSKSRAQTRATAILYRRAIGDYIANGIHLEKERRSCTQPEKGLA